MTTPRYAAAALAAVTLCAPGAAAVAADTPTPPTRNTSFGAPDQLDVLYIGAHPDDEASTLSTFGQWQQKHDVRTGVVTITRGEGGGNAVGPEEGPALGLLREHEERRAVGKAGIKDIFYLDEVDFYYTVSEPLTAQTWGHEETLAKIVRLIRQTRPKLVMTMNPAPTPGNHGNHQEAALLATEAYYAAADPRRFPDQLTKEGLRAWAPSKMISGGALGSGSTGPECSSSFQATDPSADIFGVWSGATSPDGRTWAAVERDAQREYKTQGWAVFPDVSSDPAKLGCDWFTQIDSRVPFPAAGSTAAASPQALLYGALIPQPGGLPLGTGLRLTTTGSDVMPGRSVNVDVRVSAPRDRRLTDVRLAPTLPTGWTVEGNRWIGTIPAGSTVVRRLAVTVPAGATTGTRARVGMLVRSGQRTGSTDTAVRITPAVTAEQELLPRVATFNDWASAVRRPMLQGLVTPVLTLPSGGSREVTVTVTNHSTRTQAGRVTPQPPAGFAVSPSSAPYSGLAPGESTTVTFRVTNTDASLPTSNQGGTPGAAPGDYMWTLRTTSLDGASTSTGGLELVPTTTIHQADVAPTVDGKEASGEYPGPELDLSRLWEGTACSSAADCSATGRVVWKDDTLYVLVHVRDDVLGSVLDDSDCKRHWRTDSVELAFDPRGDSENTSTTFKALILPTTTDGGPCFGRDADNHQGGPETAPGMKVASTVTSPYTGYTVETSIPMADLPGAIDPQHLGMNLFVYDSDTQDKTGQTRIGWSTWQGVQGDPYRWGQATVAGYTPPADRPTEAPAPIIPLTALNSLQSPPSIAQTIRTNIPAAGRPAALSTSAGWLVSAALGDQQVQAQIEANAPGEAWVNVADDRGVVGQARASVSAAGRSTVTVRLTRQLAGHPRVLMGWLDQAGRMLGSRAPLG